MSIEEEKQKLKNSLRYEKNSYSWAEFTEKEMDEMLSAAAIVAAACSYEISAAESGGILTMTEYLAKSTAVDVGYLTEWFINSVAEYNEEKLNEPRWTEEHIEELTNDFIVIPKNTPSADVTPVVHGHWVRFKEHDACYVHMRCSACFAYWSDPSHADYFRYCPNCGAKMDEEV